MGRAALLAALIACLWAQTTLAQRGRDDPRNAPRSDRQPAPQPPADAGRQSEEGGALTLQSCQTKVLNLEQKRSCCQMYPEMRAQCRAD